MVPPDYLYQYVRLEHLSMAPNGVMFVDKSVREGVLPRMLSEILQTRIMVKRAMKGVDPRRSPRLHRMLNARQLGLKLIANVTYGYTSASFSGRMPCVDIAVPAQRAAHRTSHGEG